MPNKIAKDILLAILLAASLNLATDIYEFQQEIAVAEEVHLELGISACMFPRTDRSSRLYIEFWLILSLIGVFLRRPLGFILFLSGLSATLTVYAVWWMDLFYSMREAGGTQMPDNTAYLMDGNICDVLIAAAVALLLLWQVQSAIIHLREARRPGYQNPAFQFPPFGHNLFPAPTAPLSQTRSIGLSVDWRGRGNQSMRVSFTLRYTSTATCRPPSR